MTGVGTAVFLALCVLLFVALARSGRPAERHRLPPEASWGAWLQRLAGEVRDGVRVLARLAGARGARRGRPWT